VPAELEPPELAALVDYAERPRVEDWSLRSALTRYAQPQPKRVSDVLELVRRIEFAVRPHLKVLDREGPAYWEAIGSGDGSGLDPTVVGLLRAMVELDALGDALATWAVDPRQVPPDAAVDAATTGVTRQLDELGVPREQRQRPPRPRS
jgi:hypothetical protein